MPRKIVKDPVTGRSIEVEYPVGISPQELAYKIERALAQARGVSSNGRIPLAASASAPQARRAQQQIYPTTPPRPQQQMYPTPSHLRRQHTYPPAPTPAQSGKGTQQVMRPTTPGPSEAALSAYGKKYFSPEQFDSPAARKVRELVKLPQEEWGAHWDPREFDSVAALAIWREAARRQQVFEDIENAKTPLDVVKRDAYNNFMQYANLAYALLTLPELGKKETPGMTPNERAALRERQENTRSILAQTLPSNPLGTGPYRPGMLPGGDLLSMIVQGITNAATAAIPTVDPEIRRSSWEDAKSTPAKIWEYAGQNPLSTILSIYDIKGMPSTVRGAFSGKAATPSGEIGSRR